MKNWETPLITNVDVTQDITFLEIYSTIHSELNKRTKFIEKYKIAKVVFSEEEQKLWERVLNFYDLNEDVESTIIFIRDNKLFADYKFKVVTKGNKKGKIRIMGCFIEPKSVLTIKTMAMKALNLKIKIIVRCIASMDPDCTPQIRQDLYTKNNEEIYNYVNENYKKPLLISDKLSQKWIDDKFNEDVKKQMEQFINFNTNTSLNQFHDYISKFT